jgi:hypothetical protein
MSPIKSGTMADIKSSERPLKSVGSNSGKRELLNRGGFGVSFVRNRNILIALGSCVSLTLLILLSPPNDRRKGHHSPHIFLARVFAFFAQMFFFLFSVAFKEQAGKTICLIAPAAESACFRAELTATTAASEGNNHFRAFRSRRHLSGTEGLDASGIVYSRS